MGRNSKKEKKAEKGGRGIKDNFIIESIPNGLQNKEVLCKPKRLPKVPSHLPKLPNLFGGFGTCGSGKSNAFVNLIQAYYDYGSITDIYIISPTYSSNASLQTLPVDPKNVYEESRGSVGSLMDIKRKIMETNEHYLFEKEYKRIYKIWSGRGGSNKLSFQEMSLLKKEEFRPPIKVPWPQPLIFIDDMTHTELMSNTINNELSHLSLHHRHLEGVGVTIIQAFQTFKSGMPKVVRTNLGCAMLFPTCNLKEIEEIYSELANHVTYDTFKSMLFEATKEPHSFLFINKTEKDPARQFGINFDRVFVVDVLEERRKILKM